MKIRLSVLLAPLLLAGLFVIAAIAGSEARTAVAEDSRASVTIRIESVVSEVGAEATVAVEAKDISGSLDAWDILISYDPDVAAAVSCTVHAGGVCDAESDAGMVEVISLDSAGLVSDTVLATVTFRCENEGTTDLSLTNQLGGLPDIVPEVETKNGVITCQQGAQATSPSSLPSTGMGGGADAGLAPSIIALAAVGLAMLTLSIAAGGKGT